MDLPFDPAIPFLGIYLKEPKTLIQNKMSTPMFTAGIIYNHQDLEAAQVPINTWVDKTTMRQLHNGILLGQKKEENFTLCNSMDEPGEHYAKWNKIVRKSQIPYDFTYMWNLKNKIN